MDKMEIFLAALSHLDRTVFQQQIYGDFSALEPVKKGNKGNKGKGHQARYQAPAAAAAAADDDYEDDDDDDDEAEAAQMDEDESTFEAEFAEWKTSYYKEKLHVEVVDAAFLQLQAQEYMTGLQWVLYYYYCGVPDWGWCELSGC
jgi:5'-3' exonuclease